MSERQILAAASAAFWLGAAACSRHHGAAASVPTAGDTCGAVSTALGRNAPVESLGGSFAIRLVATSGARAGRWVDGDLVLRQRQTGSASGASRSQMPFAGTASIQLEEVGAIRLGNPASADPAMPGVGAYVTRDSSGGVTSLLLRVGSNMNAGGPPAFDAAFTVLYVRRVSSGGIWGNWRSSSGTGIGTTQSEGNFCALRLTP